MFSEHCLALYSYVSNFVTGVESPMLPSSRLLMQHFFKLINGHLLIILDELVFFGTVFVKMLVDVWYEYILLFFFCRGMESVVTDYLEKYIPWINKIWLIISMLTFGSVYYFNYNDVGVCKAIKMLWSA